MAPRVVSHTHQEGGPVCIHRTKKACDDAYADWQAMQSVIFAYKQVIESLGDSRRPWWLKDRSHDAVLDVQIMQYIAGEREEITNKEGLPSRAPFTKRVRRAIERFMAGDIPAYNLYGGLATLQSVAATHVEVRIEQEAGMPYRNGKRISNEEWSSGNLTALHTGPRGVNPGEPFTVEAVEGSKGADEGNEDENKMVYGTKVLDKDEVLTQEIDTQSVASDSLSGDTPGEPSGEDRDEDAVDAGDEPENVTGSAVEAEQDFVEDAEAEAEQAPKARKSRGKSK